MEKKISLTILGIVAVLALAGLVMHFSDTTTGAVFGEGPWEQGWRSYDTWGRQAVVRDYDPVSATPMISATDPWGRAGVMAYTDGGKPYVKTPHIKYTGSGTPYVIIEGKQFDAWGRPLVIPHICLTKACLEDKA